MFNSKLKQKIAQLEANNEQLQRQYNLVHGLLLERQDEVVALQREIAAFITPIKTESVISKNDLLNVRRELLSEVNNLRNSIQDSIDTLIEEFDDPDEDEDDLDE